MKPMSDWGRALREQYPRPGSWPAYDPKMIHDVHRFVNLWMTEGIPFAFRDYPMIFEYCREQFAARLGETSKAISLVGSARLGSSLRPDQFGRDYDHKRSDIDLFLVSSKWFDGLTEDAELWLSRYRAGLAVPKKQGEIKNWPANADQLPKDIRRGFINIWMLPLYNRYAHAQSLLGPLETFRQNLNNYLPGDRQLKTSLSIRVYKDWKAAQNQIGYSIAKAWERYSELQSDD